MRNGVFRAVSAQRLYMGQVRAVVSQFVKRRVGGWCETAAILGVTQLK
jgi:hypothetical protein